LLVHVYLCYILNKADLQRAG